MLSECDEAQLDLQAEELAAKSLASLPEAARQAKLPTVKAGILKRLRAQAEKAAPPQHTPPTAPGGTLVANDGCDEEADRRVGLRRPPTELPPPQDGIEACGDDPWFADPQIRLALRDAVEVAHAELKILVGNPAEEIARILPPDGRVLGAGAVLRLGGQHLGGYGTSDIAYAYRQLSRALHPDKNPDIPEATAAFKRLGECQHELKQGLEESRASLLKLSMPLRGPGALQEEELLRPQEALFAESARLIAALLALYCEGTVPAQARQRAAQYLQMDAVAGGGSWARPCNGTPQSFLSSWFQVPDFLQFYGSQAARTAYDCSAKRYRAHFLCSLSRLALLESQQSEGCVRQQWGDIWRNFPEIGLWQQLRTALAKKCRPHGRNEASDGQRRERSRSPRKADAEQLERERWSQWARRWRKMINAVLPCGTTTAAPWSDPEVRKLCAAMWRDFVDPLGKSTDTEESRALLQALILFRTEKRGAADVAAQKGAAPAEWAFVPAADLLLVVGEGLVGMTVEGVFVQDAAAKRMPFAMAIFQALT